MFKGGLGGMKYVTKHPVFQIISLTYAFFCRHLSKGNFPFKMAMQNVATKSGGSQVTLSTSYDHNYPPEHIIDG